MQRKMDPVFCGALGAREAGSLWAIASSVGLGPVLRQKTTPVASSSMTPSEQRRAQVETEVLLQLLRSQQVI